MGKNIFEFHDYKEFLGEQAKLSGRGFKKALAGAAQCQTTYISQILGGKPHLSLEQAQAALSFLGLTREEGYYFLLLVEKARAGTPALRAFLEDRARVEREKHLVIRDRVKLGSSLSVEAKATYYSSWHYAAVHMLITIPKFQTLTEIARKLQLTQKRSSEVLEFLTSVGLTTSQNGRYSPGDSQIYLEKTSPLMAKHHTNWRIRAIESLDQDSPEEIHFSGVFTLTSEASERIRTILVQSIEDSVNVVKEAKEEKLVAMGIDFFEL